MSPSDKENSAINLQAQGVYKIINELKRRILGSFMAFIIPFGFGLCFAKKIIAYLIGIFPFHSIGYIQTNLTESWGLSFKIAFLIGLIFIIPVSVYNYIKFNENLFKGRQILQNYLCLIIAYFMFLMGIALAYSKIIPAVSYLLYGYGTEIKSTAIIFTLSNYINFCIEIMTFTGFMLAVPATLIYGAKTQILTQYKLKKLFKFLFMSIVIISFLIAFMNPLFEFILLLVFALLFYILGLFLCKLFE